MFVLVSTVFSYIIEMIKMILKQIHFFPMPNKLLRIFCPNAISEPAVCIVSGPVVVGWVRILSLPESFLQCRAGSTIVNFQKNNENVRSDNQPGLLLKLTFVRFQNTFLEDVLCPQPKVF